MTLEELRLMRLVQSILVRNYVDTQRLDVQVVGSSVYIEGEFHVFEYHPTHQHTDRVQREMGMKRLLMQIEHEIRRIGEVSHVEMKFRNWNRVGLQWVGRSSSGVV
jgi:signal transduction histidine kinase